MREGGIETVDLLKIDVEGAEWEDFRALTWPTGPMVYAGCRDRSPAHAP
jgi:hypothetical protein